MTITRVGATKRFSDNWENIFGGDGRTAAKQRTVKSAAKSGAKKSAKTKARKPAKKKAQASRGKKAARRK
jgi:hypothetical protein